jgi:hypothetical protein
MWRQERHTCSRIMLVNVGPDTLMLRSAPNTTSFGRSQAALDTSSFPFILVPDGPPHGLDAPLLLPGSYRSECNGLRVVHTLNAQPPPLPERAIKRRQKANNRSAFPGVLLMPPKGETDQFF